MTDDQETDSRIIRRSLDDPRVFGELYERHARIVGAYAARRVGPVAADDVLSETFLIAFRKRGRYDREHPDAKPWLLGIATRVAHRHRTAERRQLLAWEAALADGEVAIDDEDGTIDRLDAEAALRDLLPHLRTLSTRDLDTLLLSGWGGLDHAGVAAALHVPVGTVKSRLNRVRRKIEPLGRDVRPAHPHLTEQEA